MKDLNWRNKLKFDTCPFCQEQKKLIQDIDNFGNKKFVDKLININSEWTTDKGICSKCIDYFDVDILREENLLPSESELKITTINNYIIPPTPWRLNVDQRFTGKGITICFIDSGFYYHPDLVKPQNRILKIIDVTSEARGDDYFNNPHDESWHGTMTSNVCAGNGSLSNYFYKGIANEANLVLIKVWEQNGISAANIARGIRWAIEHKDEYNIKIINLSVTDDDEKPYKVSEVDIAAEEAIEKGIVVVAAVGNDTRAKIKAPASSPNVISVGGIDDHNSIILNNYSMYHSTFGNTIDGIQKPELIAPSIWIAAPILPESKEHKEAKLLFHLLSLGDDVITNEFNKIKGKNIIDFAGISFKSPNELKEIINKRIKTQKFLTPDYMHADGTSFAAPILSSIIAQMLEVNPSLTPSAVREILFLTATQLKNVDIKRQGYGIINAKGAVAKALFEKHNFNDYKNVSPVIRKSEYEIDFIYHNHTAKSVMLVGDMNGWSNKGFIFKKENFGYWKCTIPLLPNGVYKYKYIVDGVKWINDLLNPFKEDDGYNGFNSKLILE